MEIVTWNINSIRARRERVAAWVEAHRPDLLCLQETKVEDGEFPRDLFEDLGYAVEVFGQRTYNGVAMVVREGLVLEDVHRGLPGDPVDEQSRLMAATVASMRVVTVYVPNGQAIGSEKFAYKLAWLERLRVWLEGQMGRSGPLVVCGDFNVAPDERDVYDAVAHRDSVMFTVTEREAYARLLQIGLTDLLRVHDAGAGPFTWWDYRRLGFQKNRGWRIDHVLGNAAAVARIREVVVDREARKGNLPSDHAPVIARFA